MPTSKTTWENIIDIEDAWSRTENKTMEKVQLIKVLMQNIKTLDSFFKDKDLRNIYDEMEDIVKKHEDMITKDINDVMNKLYDWGDQTGSTENSRKCFIKA